MKNLAGALAQRRASHLMRQRLIIEGPQGATIRHNDTTLLSFCSNDYLGLANHPQVVKALQQGAEIYGVGSGASHLTSGHSRAHHELELALADFCQQPRALLFSSGYMANLGLITTLANRHDIICQDRLNHASLIDANQLSGARLHRYTHGNMTALQQLLEQHRHRHCLIISDGVFSMDGDITPLPELLGLAEKYHSWLILDEAHALGVIGTQGRGCYEYFSLTDNAPQHNHLITVGTLGKAFGTSGAFVAGSEELIETLIQHARSYIYTTALPPAIAHATLTSLSIIKADNWRREHLHTLIQRFRQGAEQLSLPLLNSSTPIQPLLLGDSERALKISQQLLQNNILISAIRPPTVPQNQARLRITLSAAHHEKDIDQLLTVLEKLNLSNNSTCL